MDILKSKTVTGSAGYSTINSGLSLDKIIKVSRQGEEKNYSGGLIASLDGSNWAYVGPTKRIAFGTNYSFAEDELIHIIYKL
jgi:hypothetical protein